MSQTANVRKTDMKFLTTFPPTLLFVIGWGCYLLLLFPGFMTIDTVHQLLEGRSGEIGDWHSPVMTWFFGAVDGLYSGPGGMLVAQVSLIWGALWLFYRVGFADSAPRLGAVFLVALMFYPAVLGVAGAIWKDILMAGFAVLLAGAVMGAIEKPALKWHMTILALVAAVLVLLMRLNGIFLIFPLMVALSLAHLPSRGGFAMLCAILAGAAISIGLALSAMAVNEKVATRHLHSILSVAIFDVSGTVANLPSGARQEALFVQLPNPLTQGRSTAQLAATYNARDWQSVFKGDAPGLNDLQQFQTTFVAGYASLTPSERDALMGAWVAAIMTEPKAYLTHRADVFGWVSGFRRYQWQPAIFDPAAYPAELQAIVAPFSQQTNLQAGLERLFWKLSNYAPYKPWFCLLAAILLLTYLLARRRDEIAAFALCLAVPAHMFGLFLFAPTPDFRYSHVIFILTGLAFALTLCRPRQRTEQTSKPQPL